MEQLEDRSLLALVPQLVADINATPATVALDTFNPGQIVDVGGIAYFSGGASVSTDGLWRSDGTAAGTYLVKEISPGFASSQVANLTNVGGTLFFSASDGTHGVELWKSDGTEAGTLLVKDIVPGASSATLTSFVNVNGMLFFVGNDGTSGAELWKSDGTETGTSLVKDIVPGLGSAGLANFISVNNTLYFSANDGISGVELWRSDGTAEGTVLAADILPGAGSSNLNQPVNINGILYFAADDGVHGRELWKFDTAAGVANLLKDIQAGAANSSPSNLSAVNGTLFFYSSGIWKSDGTSDGTVKIKTGVDIRMSAAVNNTLYFWTGSRDLWKTDGTPEGTRLVDNTRLIVTGLASVNGTLYYATNISSIFGDKLWKTDPSLNGTVVVRDIDRGSLVTNYPRVLSNIGGKLFFSASGGAGPAVLWTSDGTAEGTHSVPNGAGLTASAIIQDRVVGNTVYAVANDGLRGEELWRSDGTSSGTFLVKDIISPVGGSEPLNLINLDGMLLFSAYPGSISSRTVFRSDGTLAGTTALPAAPDNPQCFQNVGGTVFFQSTNAVWKTDGTNAGTVMVRSASPTNSCSSATAGGLYYYTAAGSNGLRELWRSDGTSAGTFIVMIGLQGLLNSSQGVAAIGSTLFFTIDDGTNGLELWKSDGTIAGTTPVKDIRPGPDSSSPVNLVNLDGTLYFFANDGTNGAELWRSDGTSDGTTLVKDINPIAGLSASLLTNVNGRLFFYANDGASGSELWTSDGTSEGTKLLKDINSGAAASDPRSLTNINGVLYFSANDGVHGSELWRSDGTAAGTYQLPDIAPGPASSFPNSILPLGNTIVFTADDGLHGSELWTLVEINEVPLAGDDSFDTLENVPLTITNAEYLVNDSDADSDLLSAAVIDQPGHGSVSLRLDGSFVYKPVGGFSGLDKFTYRVSDGQAQSNVATISLNVAAVNDQPVVVLGGDVSLGEGQFFAASGSFGDPDGGESWTARVNYGDGGGEQPLVLQGNKTFQLGHAYVENGDYAVTVSVRDSSGLIGSASFRAIVSNVVPQNVAWSGPLWATRGQSLKFVGGFNDPGTADTHVATVDWGDRSSTAATVTKTGGAWQVDGTHKYASGGIFQTTLTVTDDDGGVATQSTTVMIVGARINGSTFEIVGTAQRDSIKLSIKGNALLVNGSLGRTKIVQAFPLAGVQNIVAYLGEGNDTLTVDAKVKFSLLVNAGGGNDVIAAGGGAAVLIGGLGQDQLTGGGKSDLLIAGTTAYDNRPTALAAILAEWSSGRPLADRMSNLRSGAGPVLDGLNIALKAQETMFDDTAIDKLLGGGDLDWYWSDLKKDQITGKAAGEAVN